MTGNEIRKTFLKFFEERGHRVVRSSSLVPTNDPTLLFTNAGMNQFKDVFLGLEQRDYKRATSCQKCVRAGGKHNDLENVGFTNRHHTFFEMLGNFSFGDYFKKEAIEYAMELVTSKDWFGIPLDKLYFTVFGGAEVSGNQLPVDSEAAAYWEKVGAPKDRIVAVPGLKENFWAMGDTGPCGPCSEIFYDMGPAASDQGHADCKFGCDCGRYVEIWNLVFMQFNRVREEGPIVGPNDAASYKEERLDPLPKPCVDTGMGLERVAAVMLNLQDPSKFSNYDTDLFRPLRSQAAWLCGKEFSGFEDTNPSLRIVADHSRAATFLISDGVIPSNEGRGYVLRKIIRRALRHARILNAPSPFLSPMSTAVRAEMREAYPELEEHAVRMTRVLDEEENQFTRTVEVGLKKLDEDLVPFVKAKEKQGIGWYPGANAFRLYDTFGLPLDFIEDVLRDNGLKMEIEPNLTARWRNSARAPKPPGRVCTRNRPAQPMQSSRAHSKPSRTFTLARAQAIAASKPSSRNKAR